MAGGKEKEMSVWKTLREGVDFGVYHDESLLIVRLLGPDEMWMKWKRSRTPVTDRTCVTE